MKKNDLLTVSIGNAFLVPALVGICCSDSIIVALCTLAYVSTILLMVYRWEFAKKFTRRFIRASIRLQIKLHILP